MPLRIETFRNDSGGNALYKALSHPLAAEKAHALLTKLRAPFAIYDPEGNAEAFDIFYPLPAPAHYFVQNLQHLGHPFKDVEAQPVTEITGASVETLFVASFDAERKLAQIRHLLPTGMEIFSLDALKLPAELLTVPARYVSPLNFATNFVFFRDEAGHHTRLTTANYWPRYGAGKVSLWCLLFGDRRQRCCNLDGRMRRSRIRRSSSTAEMCVHVSICPHSPVNSSCTSSARLATIS